MAYLGNTIVSGTLKVLNDVNANKVSGDGSGLTALNASNISSGTLNAARLATSGASAGSYGPSAAVTGTNNTTMNVPYITVDAYGRVTSISNKVYTSKDTVYTHPTTAGNIHLPSGGASGNFLKWSSAGTGKWESLTKDEVTTALGYTPPTTNTTYAAGTGLSLSGTTFNHSNSVTAGTAGTSSATSGSTLAVPYVTFDAQGHVTAVGTHTHTVTGFAATSHGNHVPATQTASNSVFLRNDNTWQTVTPANIGAAASSHTHNYAGSASAGGAANSLLNFTAGLNGVAEHDANNIKSNGVWYYTSNGPATSLGASTNDGALYSQAYSTSWAAQIAQDYRNGNLFIRGLNNGTWSSWLPVLTSSSTLDATKLSGLTKAQVTTALGYTPPTTNTTYAAGTGLSLSGTTFNHASSITAGTAGTSSATSGATLAVPYVTYNTSGHITAAGTHTHTISGFLTAHQTIKQDAVTGATGNRFGTCATAAATAAKAVSITAGTPTLEAGLKVTVKFTYANTAGTPTLNVNSLGAKNIFHNGAQITTGANKALLAGVCDFVYDGTQFHLVGNYIDTNTNTTYSAGTGMALSGTTFNHSNSVTAGTAGTSSATSGSTLAVPYVTYDAQGHITATGTHTHTVSGFLTAHQTIKQNGVTGATGNCYGACSTAAATAAKAVSITAGTPALEAGLKVTVKFTYANTASSPTLNVNSLGAKNIAHNGSQITSGANKALLAGVCDFVYDGTQFHLVGNYIDTNTQTITGVKGNSESSYRTGNVNLTAANIGAAASNHNHSGVYTPYAASVGSNQKFIYTNSSGALTAANFEIWVTDT